MTDANKDTELTLEALYDVPVQISVVLGKTSMPLNQLLKLGRGAVIELERAVGEPIDVYVNDKMVAKGEIVIVDNKLGVTLTEVVPVDKETAKLFK
jgi:flagellar motor switch protein FliN